MDDATSFGWRHISKNIPRPGDVILVNARKKLSKAQSILRRKSAIYSHAALSINRAFYVDSLPNLGIGIREWKDLIEFEFKCFRYTVDEEVGYNRVGEMLKFYNLQYDYFVGMRDKSEQIGELGERLFCSEFVAKIYSPKELGIDRESKNIWPVDLQDLERNNDWRDVTYIYEPIVKGEIPVRQDDVTIGKIFDKSGRVYKRGREAIRAQEASIKKLDEGIAALKGMIGSSEID
jgi:hypothetical protein